MTSNKKPAFGGYSINFGQVEDTTLGEVFGTDDMPPSEMTKRIWAFVKENELSNKPPAPVYNKLLEYWDNNELEDMKLKEVVSIMEEMEVEEKAFVDVKAIFKKQKKNIDDFETEFDKFIDVLVAASKAKNAKTGKKGKKSK